MSAEDVMQKKQQKKRAERVRFYAGTFVLWFFFVGLAIALGDIEVVFNLIGAISSNLIGCVFPTLFYLKLTEKHPKSKTRFYVFKFLLYMTFVFLVVCVTSEVMKIINE